MSGERRRTAHAHAERARHPTATAHADRARRPTACAPGQRWFDDAIASDPRMATSRGSRNGRRGSATYCRDEPAPAEDQRALLDVVSVVVDFFQHGVFDRV